jgi:small subunit ribosomal protein S15
MARMHTRRRGSSSSDRPLVDEPPEWSADDAEAVEERVVELAEQGLTAAEIGIELRDNGVKGEPVPDVSLVTGKKVSEILEENDAEPEYPEDLVALMEKAIRVRDHVDENNTDAANKRAYQNVESKIRRLADYYRGDKLPEDFKYSPENARRIVE